MGKFDGILICTDLDGTLYRNDKTVSSENRDAIEYFKSEGGYFTFITGRLPYYSVDAYRAASPNVPYGCVNGGGVYDGAANEYVWKMELPSSALELVSYIDGQFSDIGIQLCCFDKTCFAKENATTVKFRAVTGLPEIFCDYHNFNEPIAKIIFCTDEERKLLSVEKMLREHKMASDFDFIRSERALFEILPKGVNKGLALEKLAEYLRVDMSRTIAIGDYDNDTAMLRKAGCGIAVANASPSALAAADVVTVANEEHALAMVIGDLERGKLLS